MKALVYLLTVLLLSAQVDDCWVAPSVASPDPLINGDDEYLPPQRRPEDDNSILKQELVYVGLTPPAGDVSFDGKCLAPEWDLAAPFAPAPLYVFMTLLI
jgi:hypothetical protein